jgi:hypothetical protein
MDPALTMGIFARASLDVPVVGHAAGINAVNDVLFIIREEPEPGSNPTSLAFVPTDLDALQEDVILQFDVFGNEMRLWAWRPNEPMPLEPQLTATDDVLPMGEFGVFFDAGPDAATPGSGVFRYVHVASTHIPEPSTLAIALLGAIGLVGWMRGQIMHGRFNPRERTGCVRRA